MCEIDLMEHPMENFITLECDHRYCKDCMGFYLESKIKSNEVSDE